MSSASTQIDTAPLLICTFTLSNLVVAKDFDELLKSMKAVKSEEASEMLVNLTKIMDKFDVKELEGAEKQSMLSKLIKGVGNSVAKLFQKYYQQIKN